MRYAVGTIVIAGMLSAISPSFGVESQPNQEQTVVAATTVLTEVISTSVTKVPESMLKNSHGVAIIPNVIKGSFIVGARHGHGLLFVREADGSWHAPVFITMSGGNIGWQIGVQSSDIVLVFKTARSIEGILSGKFTLGADAAVAAGPVGREGTVATDGQLKAEIYSYSRSRGLFAGVAVDGSIIQVDSVATGSYYRSNGPGQPGIVPPSAAKLTQMVADFVGHPKPEAAANLKPVLADQYSATEADLLRTQLNQIAPQLFEILDTQWRQYLALPESIGKAGPHPAAASLQKIVDHYNRIDSDPQFKDLATRPEFQSVHGLLKHYQQSLQALATDSQTIKLPPPPN